MILNNNCKNAYSFNEGLKVISVIEKSEEIILLIKWQ